MPGWHHPVFASRHILDHKNAKTFCVDPITRFGGVFPDYYEMVYGELGRFPMLINRKIRILKYWVKIVNGKACPLVKQMYNVLYNATLSVNRVLNWASLVKSLIDSLGYGPNSL